MDFNAQSRVLGAETDMVLDGLESLQAIDALRTDPAGATAMAERGRTHARDRFSLQAMVRGVSDALAGLD